MTGLQRVRSFDPENGFVVAEAGLTIGELLKFIVPKGFFVPVTPGTSFVTLGGAVANDVHGKNHNRAGTFGAHVRSLLLERSNEGMIRASPTERTELFAATVGGLGLTGIISEVELRLQPIRSAQLSVQTSACNNLEALCSELRRADQSFEHVVSWIDCTATGSRLGRGIVSCANWCTDEVLAPHEDKSRTMPTERLGGFLNSLTLKTFNSLYHATGKLNAGIRIRHYKPFLYPLDSIQHWNRLYGPRGFFQYQCVVPDEAGHEPIRDLLRAIASSGEGSFLAVLKRFGNRPSPGMLSFPMPGLTLALDFRNRGRKTAELFERLDAIVAAAGGRLYAAKDQRIPSGMFKQTYPRFEEFSQLVDARCKSDFWKKINP